MSTCPHARTVASAVSSCVDAAQQALTCWWGQLPAASQPATTTASTASAPACATADELPQRAPFSVCCTPNCIASDLTRRVHPACDGRWELGRASWLCGYLAADASGLHLCDATTSLPCIATAAGMQHLHSIVATRVWTLVMDGGGQSSSSAPAPVLILGRLHVLLSPAQLTRRLLFPAPYAPDASTPCAARAVCVTGRLVACYTLAEAPRAAVAATLPPASWPLSFADARAVTSAADRAEHAHVEDAGWVIELRDAVWRHAPAASRALLWLPRTDLAAAARWLASPGQEYCFPHCIAQTACVDDDGTPLFIVSSAAPPPCAARAAPCHVPAWNDVWRAAPRFTSRAASAFTGCAHAACAAPALPSRALAALRAARSRQQLRAAAASLHFAGEVTAATDVVLHVRTDTAATVRVWLLDSAHLAWHVRVLRAAGVMPARFAGFGFQPVLQPPAAHGGRLQHTALRVPGVLARNDVHDGAPAWLVAALPGSHFRLYDVQAARTGAAPALAPAPAPAHHTVLSRLATLCGGAQAQAWGLLMWTKMCDAARDGGGGGGARVLESWHAALEAHAHSALPWPLTLRDVHSAVVRIVWCVREHVTDLLRRNALNPFLLTLLECPPLRAHRRDAAERAISRAIAERTGWHAQVRWSRHMCSLTLTPAPHWLLVRADGDAGAAPGGSPAPRAQSMQHLHVEVLLCTPASVASGFASRGGLPPAAVRPPSGCVCASPPPPSCPCALLHWPHRAHDVADAAGVSTWSSVPQDLRECAGWLSLRAGEGDGVGEDTVYRIRMSAAHATPASTPIPPLTSASAPVPVLPLPVYSINALLAPECVVLLSSLASAQSIHRARERSGGSSAPPSADMLKAAHAAGQDCAPCALVGCLVSWEWAGAPAHGLKLMLTLEHEPLPWRTPATGGEHDAPARGRITVIVRGTVQQLARAVEGVRAGEALLLGPALFNRINGCGRTVTAACNLSNAWLTPCPRTWAAVQALWPHAVCVVDEEQRALRAVHQSSWPTTQCVTLRGAAVTAVSWLDIAWVNAHNGAKLPAAASTLPLQHVLAVGMAHCWSARAGGTDTCIRSVMRALQPSTPDAPRCVCGAVCAADLPACTDCLCVRLQATVVIDDGTGEARCHLTDTWTVYDICLAGVALYSAAGIALTHDVRKPVSTCPCQSEHACGASCAPRASAYVLGWDGAQIGFWALIAASLGGGVSASPNTHAAASAPLVADWVEACTPRVGEKRGARASREMYELSLMSAVRRGCASFTHVLRERATPLRAARAALALHATAIDMPSNASAHLLASVTACHVSMRHDGIAGVPLGAQRWVLDVRQFQVPSSRVMSTLAAAQASRSAPPPCASSAARAWLRRLLSNRHALLGASHIAPAVWESLHCVAAHAASLTSDALTLVQRTNVPLGSTSCMLSSFSLDVIHVQVNAVVCMDDAGSDEDALDARLAALDLLTAPAPPPASASTTFH